MKADLRSQHSAFFHSFGFWLTRKTVESMSGKSETPPPHHLSFSPSKWKEPVCSHTPLTLILLIKWWIFGWRKRMLRLWVPEQLINFGNHSFENKIIKYDWTYSSKTKDKSPYDKNIFKPTCLYWVMCALSVRTVVVSSCQPSGFKRTRRDETTQPKHTCLKSWVKNSLFNLFHWPGKSSLLA